MLLAQFIGSVVLLAGAVFWLDKVSGKRASSQLQALLLDMPPGPARSQRLGRTIRRMDRHVTAQALFLGIFLGALLFWGAPGPSEKLAIIAWACVIVAVVGIHSEFTSVRVRKKAVRSLLEELMKTGYPDEIQDTLSAVWQLKGAPFKEITLLTHLRWASPASWKWIETQKLDGDHAAIMEYLKSNGGFFQAFDAQKTVLKGFRSGDLDTLHPVLEASQYWRRVAAASTMSDPRPLQTLLGGKSRSKVPIESFFLQYHYLKGDPQALFCDACGRRPRRMEHHYFAYLRCPECHSIDHFIENVPTVVGRVGDSAERELVGRTLYLSLWNESEKQATPAEIDRVEVQAGQVLDLDWALVAVTSSLYDYFPEETSGVSIELPPSVSINKNTQKVLRDFFGEFSAKNFPLNS